jgi:hypothetical protein
MFLAGIEFVLGKYKIKFHALFVRFVIVESLNHCITAYFVMQYVRNIVQSAVLSFLYQCLYSFPELISTK